MRARNEPEEETLTTDVVMLGGFSRYASMVFVAQPDVKGAQDLKGKIVGIQRPGRVGRHIEQGLTREGLAPFIGTADIELLGIPGAGKRIQVLYELGRERLKACLAILGPRGVQAQTVACPIQIRQGERAELIRP